MEGLIFLKETLFYLRISKKSLCQRINGCQMLEYVNNGQYLASKAHQNVIKINFQKGWCDLIFQIKMVLRLPNHF